MKLYEIDEALQACFDEETGELLTPEGFERLVKTRKNKIESLYTLVNELRNAEAAPLEAEKEALETRLRDTKQRFEMLRKLLNDLADWV